MGTSPQLREAIDRAQAECDAFDVHLLCDKLTARRRDLAANRAQHAELSACDPATYPGPAGILPHTIAGVEAMRSTIERDIADLERQIAALHPSKDPPMTIEELPTPPADEMPPLGAPAPALETWLGTSAPRWAKALARALTVAHVDVDEDTEFTLNAWLANALEAGEARGWANKETELTTLREQLAAAQRELEDLRAAALRRQGVSKAPVPMADAKAFAADCLDGIDQIPDVSLQAELERRFKAAIAAGKRQGQLGRYGYLLALDEAAPRGHLDEALGDDPWAFAAAFREIVDGADGIEFPVLVGWFRRALDAGDKHSARVQVMGDHARRLWTLLEEIEQAGELADVSDASFRSAALATAEDRGAWRDLEDGCPSPSAPQRLEDAVAAAVEVALTGDRALELGKRALQDITRTMVETIDDAKLPEDLVAHLRSVGGETVSNMALILERLSALCAAEVVAKPAAKPRKKPAKRAAKERKVGTEPRSRKREPVAGFTPRGLVSRVGARLKRR